ncbi:hypothetical protein K450DRAFT_248446 [Umbelopsis ramanniana AG]|uniref:Uncharacterized protein n=1 Tax=Umbelopsis ramanniana AG TaxID=1314678 RepID=A0AAD5E7I4_UMBRA|nr:uncharacterized protein K450DRAFT_248446 [Umbelopsis ramanniana AG]KAI8578172.1 hypothetical protein K450DRAFT_248446 [Umbelopsis ramanniana AG]
MIFGWYEKLGSEGQRMTVFAFTLAALLMASLATVFFRGNILKEDETNNIAKTMCTIQDTHITPRGLEVSVSYTYTSPLSFETSLETSILTGLDPTIAYIKNEEVVCYYSNNNALKVVVVPQRYIPPSKLQENMALLLFLPLIAAVMFWLYRLLQWSHQMMMSCKGSIHSGISSYQQGYDLVDQGSDMTLVDSEGSHQRTKNS